MNDKTFNLPDLSNGDLSALLHGSAEQVSPFSKEIYIGRQSIVGMRFQGGAETLAGDLRPGDRITFLREPDNEYDKQAIMAMDSHGRKLGYIPQRENLVMSSLMDHGKVFFGRIPDISPKEYVYSRRYPKQMTESEIGIPVTITVDLYMREFPLSGDMTAIPRHGSDASYAVVSFRLTKDKPERIQHLCAIKVINGEERGLLDKRISVECLTEDRTAGMPKQYDRNRETERIALNEFKEFIGLLPIVSHGMTGKGKRALEEAYGVLLGASLSNLLIDTEEMAQNHLPDEKDYKLDNLIRRLKIHVTGDSHAERCCRRTWELYRRMDKSELHKDAISSMGSAAETNENADDILNKSIDFCPMADQTRTILRLNGILTLRELSRCSLTEAKHFKWNTGECLSEMQAALENAGGSFRPGRKRKYLYGYPLKVQEIAKKKKDYWEYHLLFEGIVVYYEWLFDARRQKVMFCWDDAGFMTVSGFEEFKGLITRKVDEIQLMADELVLLFQGRMVEAVGAPGEAGDVILIMKLIEDLVNAFKKIMIWRHNFQYINVPDQYREAVEMVAGWGDTLLEEYDHLYDQCKDAVLQIESCLAGTLRAEAISISIKFRPTIDKERVNIVLNNLMIREMISKAKVTVKENKEE